VKLRIWKSLTFFVGLILFIAACGVILVTGRIFNPPPYRIVITFKDIAPYTALSQDMVVVDEQTMNQMVASRMVHEGEIERYPGGMVIETIHAGEPMRRNAATTPGNPAAAHRLSTALTDPNLIAAVVPVTPKIIPDNVTAGDYINVTMGIAAQATSAS
jgi:Flp pilus assembly protein CpaB